MSFIPASTAGTPSYSEKLVKWTCRKVPVALALAEDLFHDAQASDSSPTIEKLVQGVGGGSGKTKSTRERGGSAPGDSHEASRRRKRTHARTHARELSYKKPSQVKSS